MEDLFPDKIFVRHNFTDFEKLLFALKYIEELKKILNKAEQEIFMLNNTLKNKQEFFLKEEEELMLQIMKLKKLTKEEKIEAHNIEAIKQLQNTIKNLKMINKAIEKQNKEIVNEIVRIKNFNYKP